MWRLSVGCGSTRGLVRSTACADSQKCSNCSLWRRQFGILVNRNFAFECDVISILIKFLQPVGARAQQDAASNSLREREIQQMRQCFSFSLYHLIWLCPLEGYYEYVPAETVCGRQQQAPASPKSVYSWALSTTESIWCGLFVWTAKSRLLKEQGLLNLLTIFLIFAGRLPNFQKLAPPTYAHVNWYKSNCRRSFRRTYSFLFLLILLHSNDKHRNYLIYQ